ncbi:uncharacterized protein [Pseudorasbora parva]|uniref:uncharacterized protein n=1 Tax=Pseudorasbora parva TaxID=51549 RepID=UPI00351F717F
MNHVCVLDLTFLLFNITDVSESGLYFDEGLEIILDEIFDEALLVGDVVQDIINVAGDAPSEIQGDVPDSSSSSVTEDVIAPQQVSAGPSNSSALPDDSAIPTTSTRGEKRLREVYGDRVYPHGTQRLRTSENNGQDYEDRGLELFTSSQLDAWNGAEFSDSAESSSDESDSGHAEIQPLFNERDLHRLSYDTLRRTNRNFERILDLVGRPLSYQETEEIVRASQSTIAANLQIIIDGQIQHQQTLDRAIEFWMNSHEQIIQENRGLRMELAGALHERHMLTTAFIGAKVKGIECVAVEEIFTDQLIKFSNSRPVIVLRLERTRRDAHSVDR